MKYLIFKISALFWIFILSLISNNICHSQHYYYPTSVQQGYFIKVYLTDQGCVGYMASNSSDEIGCEYPIDSYPPIEHILCGGLWIGAKVEENQRFSHHVTQTDNFDIDYNFSHFQRETISIDTAHSWYHTSINNKDEPNKRGIDDDNDGNLDEDELDGIDNDGDGKIDEDYGAVSESDYYCFYTDTSHITTILWHAPLGIKVIQKSYAWGNACRVPMIVIDYKIINLGIKNLDSLYIGIQYECGVAYGHGSDFRNDLTGYWPELRTSYTHNPKNRDCTPVGITLLNCSKPLSDLKYFYKHFNVDSSSYTFNNISGDSIRYNWLSNDSMGHINFIQPNQSSEKLYNSWQLFSFGPFNDWTPGETLKVSVAIVAGLSLRYGPENLYDNARFAQTLYARNFVPPVTIHPPNLRIEPGFNRNTLRWDYNGEGVNPEEIWDDESQLVRLFPEDHWRRANPPEGHTKGGRIFEGYRLYRSEDPGGAASSFVMLKQWDAKDSVGPNYGYDTGLEYEFVDSNLRTGKTYWYSVTSYGIPDVNKMEYVDWDGSVKETVLASESQESSVLGSRKRERLPFSVSNELGKVLVVPNPYRVDADYTLEFGGYEGRSRSWNENKRILKFTHLPPKCTIRIFTIGGDIVTTLHHENGTVGEYDWDMLSGSNRTIASGVYVFTVESEYGTQTGKFVVIR